MRRLFLVLLAANALCAIWLLLLPRESIEDAGRRPAAPAHAARLELASEYSPAPEVSAQHMASATPEEAGEPVAAFPPAGDAIAEPGSVPAGAAAAQAPAAPGAADRADARALPDASPPDGEHRDAPSDELAAAGEAREIVAAVVPAQYCVRIGPLRDGAAGERMRQRVAAWLTAARVEEGEAPDRSAFWVHVPPRPSDDEARAVVSALTARGVESFVIRDEPALLHGVSLGVFRDAQSAQQQMERMQGIGYPVAIHEKPRTRRAFFLLGALGPDAGAAVPPELEEAVAATASGARVAPARCDGIAPATGSD
ncbi:MAG: hypothetical protein IPM40_14000 [Gammaproteobacteria bacterium]|jgi:hypothetical protein|nr:hypothetical protein [Gammaproteobacteria bacterium]MBK9469910.1 hypothetical protein [Gammaproteobacteria bacterium]MBP7910747.1 hypothetical protein [Pseudomonadales bacterium]